MEHIYLSVTKGSLGPLVEYFRRSLELDPRKILPHLWDNLDPRMKPQVKGEPDIID